MKVTERYIHTGKIALSLSEWTRPTPDAPPILLLHGYGSNSQTWGRVTDKLSNFFHLFALDLRGMGRSGRYGRNSDRQTWAEDVISVIKIITSKPMMLIGHSLGGWVAAAVSATCPELISKVVLVEPYSGAHSEVRKQAAKRPPEQRSLRAKQIRNAHRPEDLSIAVSKQYPGVSVDSIKRITHMWFQMDPGLEEAPVSSSEEKETFDEIFRNIKSSTLIINGSVVEGGILSEKETARIADLIPASRVLSWPKVGHSPHIARNHDFIRAVQRFWNE
jgi:pimeloyl-ACP methyl ester carboxylesterase